jgi:hypothetical protein
LETIEYQAEKKQTSDPKEKNKRKGKEERRKEKGK